MPYHWRIRPKYNPAKTPFQPNGPWFTIPANGWQEEDLIMAGTATEVAGSGSIGVREPDGAGDFQLGPAGANPSSTGCATLLALGHAARVSADVFDVAGRRVAALMSAESLKPGSHLIVWDGRDRGGREMPAGQYFILV